MTSRVPLARRNTWDEVRSFAEVLASRVARAVPERYVAVMAKARRPGRILIDYLRNSRGATAVAAYSTRARPGAPVATPLDWEELGSVRGSDAFTVQNVPARLAKLRHEPWAGLMTGLLPHNHGVWTVEHTVDPDQCVLRDRPHWAQRLSAADARTFAPVLADPADAAGWQAGYAEYWGNRLYLTQRVCWDGSWKYVFNGFDYDELYDLDADPHELRNLAQCPEHQDRARSMMAAIWRQARRTGDRTLQGVHYYPLRLPPVGPNVAEG